MSVQQQVLRALRRNFSVEAEEDGTFRITRAAETPISPPIRLSLEQELVETHVAQVARRSTGGNLDEAVGLVTLHVEEAVESALAFGDTIRSLGVRRSRIAGRPEWYVDKTDAPTPSLADAEADHEWRA